MKEKEGKHTTEDKLKQKLEGFELPVEDFVFKNIQAEINPGSTPADSKNSRWKLISVFLLLLVGIILVSLFYPFKSGPGIDEEIAPVNKENQESRFAAPISANSEGRLGKETSKAASPEIPEGTQATSVASPETNAASKNSEEVHELKGNRAAPSDTTNTSTAVVLPENDKPGVTKNTSVTDAPLLTEIEGKPENETRDPVKNEEFNTVPLAGDVETMGLATEQTDTQAKDETITEVESVETSTTEVEDNNSALSELPPDSLQEALNSGELSDREKQYNPASKFLLITQAGVGLSYRLLQIPPYHDLQVHKDEHETSGLTFNYSLGVRYDLRDNLYLASGIGFAQFSEQYEFHHDVINHTTTNTYSYLQVPVTLGIRLWQSEKFSLYGQVGVVWNNLTSAHSSWVDPEDLTAVSHTNNGPEHPFQKNTFEGMAGLDLAFSLNQKWRIHLIPQGGLFLNSIYIQSTNLEQKPYAGSINLGVSRRF